ncbi:MAG: OmpA family protein [Nocardioidaceae bacterium]
MATTFAPPPVSDGSDSDAKRQKQPRRHRIYRAKGPGETWWFAFLLVPALIAGLAVWLGGGEIQSELATTADNALTASGLPGSTVEVSGRQALVLVPSDEDPARAREVVAGVAGISDVTVTRVAKDKGEAKACQAIEQSLDRLNHGHGITFVGGSTNLTAAGAAALRRAGPIVAMCQVVTVVVGGNTDGSVINGSAISLRRAQIVRKALLAAGAADDGVIAQGFGDSYPVLDEDSAKARALNNRVTFTVRKN